MRGHFIAPIELNLLFLSFELSLVRRGGRILSVRQPESIGCRLLLLFTSLKHIVVLFQFLGHVCEEKETVLLETLVQDLRARIHSLLLLFFLSNLPLLR